MVRRASIAASLCLFAGIGCHAGPPPKVAKTEPPITASDVTAAKFIAMHNKNAASIRSLKAAPSIVLLGEHNEREARASGHLAFERDKNFRLELDGPMRHTVADIGSNDQGFWFWVEDKKEKSIYVCDHKDINSCQLAITLQPDWIIEAMGLREFTKEEAQTIHAKPGDKPGLLVLTQLRRDAKNQTYTKETVVAEGTGRILEHKLYLGAKKELIASATVVNYKSTTIVEAPADGGVNDPAEAPIQSAVYTPEKFRLNWIKENFAIEIMMSKPSINPALSKESKLALFSEPKIPGTTRRDLAQLDPNTVQASRVYESLPSPKSGVRLLPLQPAPMGGEGATRRAIDPLPLSPDLSSTPAQPAGIVGALVPTMTDSNNLPTSVGSSWRSSSLR